MFPRIDFYAELGAGTFRGNDFPFGGGEEGQAGNEGKSGYIRVGSNLTEDSSWRAGAYMLSGNVGVFSNSKHGHDDMRAKKKEKKSIMIHRRLHLVEIVIYIFTIFAYSYKGVSIYQLNISLEDGTLTMADDLNH